MRSKKIIFLLLCLILTGCTKTYTITFNTDGGTKMSSITLKEGANIENIETPTKEGYLFVSWLKDGIEYNPENPITEDITLTATWVETPELLDNYTVTLINQNFKEQITVKENSTIKEPTVKSLEKYNFIGWYLDDEKYDFNSKITKDITLIAKYEYKKVTVTYELDGGTGLTSKTIPIDSSIEIPEPPKKEGYKFLKWMQNGKEFSFSTKITEDITIKAIWEKIEYVTIKYDTDGGNIISSTTIEKYSKITNLPTPVKVGYIFKEWQLNNQPFDIDTKIENNIVLKAIYEKESREE